MSEFDNYIEVNCVCESRFCNGLAYAQADTDKEFGKVIMLGVDSDDDSAYIWISAEKAKDFAQKLIELADKVERGET
jgi:hypothetical protein